MKYIFLLIVLLAITCLAIVFISGHGDKTVALIIFMPVIILASHNVYLAYKIQ